MGKAIAYTYSLMDRLAIYVNDGSINIDNNLIENAMRPLALGRKNWLFCGNEAPVYRAAIVHSLLASCRATDVDPRQWLEHVLVEIPSRRKSGQSMEDLLPSYVFRTISVHLFRGYPFTRLMVSWRKVNTFFSNSHH